MNAKEALEKYIDNSECGAGYAFRMTSIKVGDKR